MAQQQRIGRRTAVRTAGSALAAEHDLTGGVAVRHADRAVLGRVRHELGQELVVQPDHGCHATLATCPGCLHVPAPLTHEAHPVGEGDLFTNQAFNIDCVCLQEV